MIGCGNLGIAGISGWWVMGWEVLWYRVLSLALTVLGQSVSNFLFFVMS